MQAASPSGAVPTPSVTSTWPGYTPTWGSTYLPPASQVVTGYTPYDSSISLCKAQVNGEVSIIYGTRQ
jgi:hypothetical protein